MRKFLTKFGSSKDKNNKDEQSTATTTQEPEAKETVVSMTTEEPIVDATPEVNIEEDTTDDPVIGEEEDIPSVEPEVIEDEPVDDVGDPVPVPTTFVSYDTFGFVLGTEGADVILAYGFRTIASGGGGDDTMIAFGGTAYFRGGDGHDTLIGGMMGDTLFGDGGNDRLMVGAGDVAIGGEGADQFIFSTTDKGTVRVSDFDASEGDTLVFNKAADVTCELVEGANNTTVHFSDGLSVELYGITVEDISAHPDLFGL